MGNTFLCFSSNVYHLKKGIVPLYTSKSVSVVLDSESFRWVPKKISCYIKIISSAFSPNSPLCCRLLAGRCREALG